jgi:hypothetical protein
MSVRKTNDIAVLCNRLHLLQSALTSHRQSAQQTEQKTVGSLHTNTAKLADQK